MFFTFKKTALGVSVFMASAYLLPVQASAQMSSSPWGFTAQNRASIAALIRQVDDQGSSSSGLIAAAGTSGNITNLVCGSDGTSSAKGTGSCIILNNSDAGIEILQETNGETTASTNDTVNVDETINTIDDVLQTLEGG